MGLKPHQQRVVDEKTDLDDKRSKLAAFMYQELFLSLPKDEQSRLERQFHIMTDYSNVLKERIEAFQ